MCVCVWDVCVWRDGVRRARVSVYMFMSSSFFIFLFFIFFFKKKDILRHWTLLLTSSRVDQPKVEMNLLQRSFDLF